MSKATTAAATTTDVLTPAEIGTKTTRKLSSMAMAYLCFLVGKTNPKNTKDEDKIYAGVFSSVTGKEPFVEELMTGDPLVEKSEGGEIVPTKFGVKWALSSAVFGTNFNKIYSECSTPALHSALFALAAELSKRHEDKPIHYATKEGTPSKFWRQFSDVIDTLDMCLEAKPAEEAEEQQQSAEE